MSGSGNSNYLLQNLSSLGLGYAIAIALGFLVLLSTVLLASYVCCRAAAIPTTSFPNPNVSHPSPNGVVLPRIIFVAEEDDIDDRVANGEREDHAVPGLATAAINSYPKFAFSKSKDDSGDSVCSICLCDYREGEMLRMLPDCCHFFHLCCVDAWLRLNASCPICRTSPLPTPVSTPLLEAVPLSHFPAHGRR